MRKELSHRLLAAAMIGNLALGGHEIQKASTATSCQEASNQAGNRIADEILIIQNNPIINYPEAQLSRIAWQSEKIKGNLSDPSKDAQLNQDHAVLGTVMVLQNVTDKDRNSSEKISRIGKIRSYALKILDAVRLKVTRQRFFDLSKRNAGHLLIRINNEAENIYNQCDK